MSSAPFSDGVLRLTLATDSQRGSALLKAATELFVFEARHSRNEIAIYEELAMQLVRVTPVEDRVAVAGMLAPRADAPASVLALLAADEPSVAGPVITGAAALDDMVLLALVGGGSAEHLALVAARPGLSPDVIEALLNKGDLAALAGLAGNLDSRIPEDLMPRLLATARGRPEIASALARRSEDVDDADLVDLFLDLDDRGRKRVLQSLEVLALRDFAARRPLPRTPRPDPEMVAELARTALSRDLDRVAAILARLLDIDEGIARRLVADKGGEPLALALKAAGLDEPVATRVILFSGEGETRDYFEVKRLVELRAGVSLRSATLLAGRWPRDPAPLPNRPPHRPQLEAGTPVRAREPQPALRPDTVPHPRRERG